ncbi:TetR family transcriptional regulator [Streptomyces sp. CA-142005]
MTEKVTIPAVARRAGVNPSSVYRRWGGNLRPPGGRGRPAPGRGGAGTAG